MAVNLQTTNLQLISNATTTTKAQGDLKSFESNISTSSTPKKTTWTNKNNKPITLVLANGDKITLEPGKQYTGSGNTGVIAFY